MSENYFGKNAPLGARKKYLKPCQYPGCTEEFMGIGASKYCEEHQKPKYKKILIQMKEAAQEADYEEWDKSNIIINHDFDLLLYNFFFFRKFTK